MIECDKCGWVYRTDRCPNCARKALEAVVRAGLLRDHVLKMWSPPVFTGRESRADIAQTAVMQAIAFIMGPEFMPVLTPNQSAALNEGLALLRETLGGEGCRL